MPGLGAIPKPRLILGTIKRFSVYFMCIWEALWLSISIASAAAAINIYLSSVTPFLRSLPLILIAYPAISFLLSCFPSIPLLMLALFRRSLHSHGISSTCWKDSAPSSRIWICSIPLHCWIDLPRKFPVLSYVIDAAKSASHSVLGSITLKSEPSVVLLWCTFGTLPFQGSSTYI